MIRIAIIGAGMTGLSLAHFLQDKADIVIFEKSRGYGGRMASRVSDRSAAPYMFDHGAQFFYAKTEAFQSFLKPLIEDNIVDIWRPRFAEMKRDKIIEQRVWGDDNPHYVGVPGMNAIGKYMAQNFDILCETKIENTIKKKTWQLTDQHGETYDGFDWVISTLPAAQAAALLPSAFSHYQQIADKKMSGCFSLMLGFDTPLSLPFDAALVHDADISWISVNSSKPNRGDAFTLLVHSTNKWADVHLDDDRHMVIEALCDEASHIIGEDVRAAAHIDVHGWRYANIAKQPYQPPLIDPALKLAAGGDWCIQGRIESAFLNAMALAEAINAVL